MQLLRQRLNVTLWWVGTASYPKINIRQQRYPHWIISHISSGEVLLESGGREFVASDGSVIVHPPNVVFSENAHWTTYQWMQFEAVGEQIPVASDLLSYWPMSVIIPLGSHREAFLKQFAALQTAFLERQEFRSIAFALTVLAELMAAWEESGRPLPYIPPPHRFTELIQFMEAHLGEHLTRDQLAARVHLHPGSFDRAFRQTCGIPPMKMLQQIRLVRACRLLETTNDTLDSIALACGFSDAPRLSRLFHERYGQTPGKYRSDFKRATQTYFPNLDPKLSL